MIRVSAPGKVHLIGEHAVVYGKPAIIAAVGLRTTVLAEPAQEIIVEDRTRRERVIANLKEILKIAKRLDTLWKRCDRDGNFSKLFELFKANYLKAVVGKCAQQLRIKSGVRVIMDSDIPLGSGLGSSASIAVAVAKAMAEVNGIELTKERNNEIAFEIERWGHGRPSGGDNSACCYGGVVWFQKGNPNIIKSLEIPYRLENFVLVYSGPPERTTGELVQMVRNLDEKFRNPRIEKIAEMTYRMKSALIEKDFDRMAEIINLTQKNLSELGLSTINIDRIVAAVKAIGGAAKLCGAGGGGTVLCWHKNKARLVKAITEMGFQPIEAELGVEGVRVE